jgi:2-polyprenyl-3-methyl-5-hydroxy-6-metoxy-1,4-benzoquinol methylase
MDTNSLERLVPDTLSGRDVTGAETLRLHVDRYAFAADHARAGRLLDISCGVGYGTRLLTDRRADVIEAVGVDNSSEAIAWANQRYANARTRFVEADAYHFSDPDGFDTIVSLETIEHVPDPRRFVKHLTTLMRTGGVLIASVPTTPSMDANPHHYQDFNERSFRRLVAAHALEEIATFRQVQPFQLGALLTRHEARMAGMRRNIPGYYAKHPGKLLLRLWSTVWYGLVNRYVTIAWRASP